MIVGEIMKIFNDLTKEEIENMYDYFEVINVYKNNHICFEGDYLDSFYLVLEGKIEISNLDITGHKNMIGIISNGDLFGQSIVLSNQKQSHVNIKALCDSKLLKMNKDDFFALDNNKLLRNLLEITASKNIFLNKKINCISKNTVRDRLFEYFKNQMVIKESNDFEIEFNINQLSEYLCLNRSSVSREITKMVNEEYFIIKKNKYYLNDKYFKM